METTRAEPVTPSPERVIDDPHKDVRDRLAQFILSLIQAFLRTGYYTPDHPESKRAKSGLFEEFQGLFIQKDELTFIVRDEPGRQNILIEGVLPETQYLNRLMFRGMAEMYIPRFTRFLERKDLVSLTLKNTMTGIEFTRFIDLMSEPSFVDTHESSDKERFSRTLRERGIVHISYVFNEELLATKRNIPWRSQLALSRLKKDLSMVPLFTKLDLEGQRKIRREIIQDVTRPIRSGEVIFHILVNSDLAQTKELRGPQIDQEIIESLSDDVLLKTSQVLLNEASQDEGVEKSQGKLVALVGQASFVLHQREIKGSEIVLEGYFKHGLIRFEQLPEATQYKIKLERLTDKFLRYSHNFFEQFDKMRDKEKYLQLARAFTKIVPELIRRDRYEEILKIVTHIDRHFTERKHLSIYAGQVLEEIGRGEIPLALKEKFLTEKKEVRLAITPIFLKLHVGSVPYLLDLLRESDDQWVRKNACEILVQIGSSAINFILNELNNQEIGTESIIDIIRVLGEIKSDQWAQPLANTLRVYLNHENPRLREEALGVHCKIKGAEGEKLYLDLLNDPDLGVQKKAIQCLGRIRSKEGLAKVTELLKKSEDFPSIKSAELETRLFGALGFYGNIELPGFGLLEDFLLDTLNRRLTLGALSFLKKKKKPLSEGAVAAICETLGRVGTSKSLGILGKLGRQEGASWDNKAHEALEKIAEREAGRAQAVPEVPQDTP